MLPIYLIHPFECDISFIDYCMEAMKIEASYVMSGTGFRNQIWKLWSHLGAVFTGQKMSQVRKKWLQLQKGNKTAKFLFGS